MTIRVALEHRTVYRFERRVRLGPHLVRLRPAPHSRTPVEAYSLRVEPAEHFVNWQQDPFGNHLARLVFPEPTDALAITVDLVADLTVINPFDFFVEDYAERYPFTYERALHADLEPYLRPVPTDDGGPLLREWLAGMPPVPADGMRIVDFLVAVNNALYRDIAYTVRMEPGVQPPDTTLARRIGSCRDSAWLLVAVLRELGLAARFVSGYLVQLAPDVVALDGPAGPTTDFTDLHAWTEVYVPGAGWVGLDPTSGLFAGEGHIPLSATPHPATSAPISGLVEPVGSTMEFSNVVRRVHEDPRVTRPYAEAEWQRVEAIAREVDRRLVAGDVRLTMGGEPTFVSVDDMSAPEWTVEADGPHKRDRAAALAERLRATYSPHGVVHRGQGKWYPGEPLPRWQIALTWRLDDVPLWQDPSLVADPWVAGKQGRVDAAALAASIAWGLGAPHECVLPAYDDVLLRAVTELSTPEGDPPPEDLVELDEGAAEREPREVAAGLNPGEPVGWVLPLHRTDDGTSWATVRWRFRRGRLVALPGDSPLGLRLPLDAVSWTPPVPVPERSAFAPLPDLPVPTGAVRPEPAAVVDVEGAPVTALCVEVRDGTLCVFLPPLERLEDAAELVAVVEAAAARRRNPVVLEGYPLPRDPRTATLVVTPDPGVIEVNVHPAADWDELSSIVHTVHEAARQERLGTETFALDGAHAGTGGGNHLTLGGATPADSPLLRRPDLLVSLLTFWQHHPSLSYLFSGRFVGPTSQAPRVDEGRHETLYELEIACAELQRLGDRARPWHTDRLLRHLLTDITGNTHRAEFCIDKLFSPDSERGRLGLLELRGFEMPPHRRMALVQALLVRALVVRFWEQPYAGPFVRWGTALHDRFLLPDPVAADIADVVDDLRRHGLDVEAGWLLPFLEFRFPRLGSTEVAGVRLELRAGVEPWHVLGEEISQGGTARYVDSSVERVQVAAEGLIPERHLVTCQGVPVPLESDGPGDRAWAGVRFRAWAPPSALHPTIGVQSPLVFDLVDTWNGRSLGGFTYHVVHPGGRAYETFPVNANEAEARRSRRFETTGHTPGPVDVAALERLAAARARRDREYPRTLDLRRTRADATTP